MKKQLAHYTIILIIIIIANFFIPRLLPGSPVKTLMGESVAEMTAEEKMGILDAYHLNAPLYEQFGYYISDLVTGDWGISFSKRLPINQIIKPAILWTLLLSSVTLFFSVLIGSFLGALSALRRKKNRDLSIVLGTVLISSIPPFWIAILLLAVFGARLGWFPTYGAYSMWSDLQGWPYILDLLKHLTLPATALVITSLMPYFSTTRYSVLKTISEDYVKMAKFRGIPPMQINLGYIMRNTLIPVFTVLMMDVGYLLSGSVLVETVFSYPGLGVLMRDAVAARDYPLIQYTFLFSSLLTVAALFVADLLYHKIDPTLEVADEK
ncbi:ABC-type dipeptide/oligopeptide/nickel transport system, permease component [Desulfitobacterium dehalogenans ATCC 51507]|uniref:ABC-type dipeptide/oligopeptide/nickel transport system, permease component n=1 Tax=Desulfitobacterium dehalogenans (strain ATCC 51507 / DSM 9161 / JW/IU-DC1) TaxID=756499 RepID=I4A3Z7_DESDJ|nr:ABC transporter permease [Desulfitobacterium dehalogenans]AFL98681.1 ABC-type dipeptide/oligopeptide/nickel transport system, permease component [Desulfitobacterium dehalogenans ATCC 51507]